MQYTFSRVLITALSLVQKLEHYKNDARIQPNGGFVLNGDNGMPGYKLINNRKIGCLNHLNYILRFFVFQKPF